MTLGSTSNTFLFAPPISDIFLEAFERCGIRGTALTRRHMISAKRSINLELVSWSNRGVNLWKVVGPVSITLVAGTKTYPVTVNSEGILDVYYSTINGGGAGFDIDRIMLPISRTQYAMIPNKDQVGTPTVYWYDKLSTPQLTFWEPPETGSPQYTIKYYYLQRVQDAAPVNGQVPDIPYRFTDTLCAGLARRLARKFAPQLYDTLKQEASESWLEAIFNDQENAPVQISPTVSNYWP